jgi:hypothetical protein
MDVSTTTDDWIDLQPPNKPSKAIAPVALALRKMRDASARGEIFIERSILAMLGLKHWRVHARLGKGVNRHRIAIVPADDGAFELKAVVSPKTRNETTRHRLTLPPIDSFPDITLPAEERPYEIGNIGNTKILLIDLPSMCWKPDLKAREEEKFAKRRAAKHG